MIVRRKDLRCHDDEGAVSDAVGMRKYVEIWCGRRIVKRVNQNGQTVPGRPAIFSPVDGPRE